MIDTNYDETSFIVRQCYFTSGNDPYKKLKAALRADIQPDAWAALYRTVSMAFDPPETGKIAVKVINDYGDEVMKGRRGDEGLRGLNEFTESAAVTRLLDEWPGRRRLREKHYRHRTHLHVG